MREKAFCRVIRCATQIEEVLRDFMRDFILPTDHVVEKQSALRPENLFRLAQPLAKFHNSTIGCLHFWRGIALGFHHGGTESYLDCKFVAVALGRFRML